ncbi:MAG: YbhN family protein [Gemmatimonadales bacterium]
MTRWIRIALGLALLGFLLGKADFGQLTIRWSGTVLLAAIAATILLATAQALSALRWLVLLGPTSVRWAYLYRLYLIAAFWSLFLPTAVGGDAVRAAAASQSMGDSGKAVGTVLADRVLGVVALAVYLAVGLALVGGPAGLGMGKWIVTGRSLVAIGGTALGVIALGWLLRDRLRRVIEFGRRVVATFADLARDPRRLILGLGLGFAVQTAYLFAWLVLARGLGLQVPTASFLVTVPLVSASTMAPITLSGVGVREGAWIVLLKPYGVPAANALAMSLVYFGCWTLVAATGGVLFAMYGTADRRPQPNAATT